MANFPTVNIDRTSKATFSDGRKVDRADDGSIKGVSIYSETAVRFDLLLAPLSATEKNSILSHYAADKESAFSFTWPDDASTHTVIYETRPVPERMQGPAWWAVRVVLAGVAD